MRSRYIIYYILINRCRTEDQLLACYALTELILININFYQNTDKVGFNFCYNEIVPVTMTDGQQETGVAGRCWGRLRGPASSSILLLDISILSGNECCAWRLLLCQPFLVNQLKLLGKYKIKLLALIESHFGRIERSQYALWRKKPM